MDILEIFARNLRRVMHEKGYAQELRALESGVDRPCVSALGHGVYGAKFGMVDKLVAVPGVETGTLLHRAAKSGRERPLPSGTGPCHEPARSGSTFGPRSRPVARRLNPRMPRSSKLNHANIRIRAARGWPDEHGEEAQYLALTASEKAELRRVAQIIDFRTADSKIFSQGDDAAFIYLHADGVVRVYHTLRNGERQVLAFHWPGDVSGLAEHGRYVNSAEIIVSSRVYRFPVKELERLLLTNPNIQDAFLVKAIHDLRNTQRQLIVMGRFNTLRRVAVFLVDCSAHEHYFDQSKQILTLAMSRYDIADYLGTSAETVTRALAHLEGGGMLHRVTPRNLNLKLDQLKAFIDFD